MVSINAQFEIPDSIINNMAIVHNLGDNTTSDWLRVRFVIA